MRLFMLCLDDILLIYEIIDKINYIDEINYKLEFCWEALKPEIL